MRSRRRRGPPSAWGSSCEDPVDRGAQPLASGYRARRRGRAGRGRRRSRRGTGSTAADPREHACRLRPLRDRAGPIRSPGPLFVDGAEPGDVLEVEILEYATPAFGVNCVIPGFGFLADVFTEPFLVPWELDGARRALARAPRHRRAGVRARRRDRGGAVARADGGAAGAGGTDPRRRRGGRRRRPRVRNPADRGGRAAHDPAARDRRQHGHPPARRRLDAAAAGVRAGRAPLARRRPLRPGRRRGVRHGDRNRGRGERPRSASARRRAGRRASPPT